MNKKYIFLAVCISNLIYSSSYLISNRGSYGSGKIALFDAMHKNSVLIGGYTDTTMDNGHCVGNIISNQLVTVIIPESLSKFSPVNESCTCQNQSNCKYSSSCPYYCGSVIEEGSIIQINTTAVNKCYYLYLCDQNQCYLPRYLADADVPFSYNSCPQNYTSATLDDNTTLCCTTAATTENLRLNVSPLCQQMSNFILENFANTSPGAKYTVKEYADCSADATSYCAVTFQPSNSFKLGINTDTLSSATHNAPATCTLSGNNPQCSFLALNGSTNTCGFLLQTYISYQDGSSKTYNGIDALNQWFQYNYDQAQNAASQGNTYNYTNLPEAYLNNCTSLDIDLTLDLAYNKSAPFFQKVLDIRKRAILRSLHLPPIELPDPQQIESEMRNPGSIRLTPVQKRVIDTFKKNKPIAMKYFAQLTKLEELLATKGAVDVMSSDLGIPCIGSATEDTDGSMIVTYTCATLAYTPNYVCTFTFTGPSKTGQCGSSGTGPYCPNGNTDANGNPIYSTPSFSLYSSDCSFPVEDFVFSGPTIGTKTDFNCGFCGQDEMQLVAQSKTTINPALLPFDDSQSGEPTCLNGFVSSLTPERPYNYPQGGSCYNGVLAYNNAGEAYSLSVDVAGKATGYGFNHTVNPFNPNYLDTSFIAIDTGSTCAPAYTWGYKINGINVTLDQKTFNPEISLGLCGAGAQGWAYANMSKAFDNSPLAFFYVPNWTMWNCYLQNGAPVCTDLTANKNNPWLSGLIGGYSIYGTIMPCTGNIVQ